MKRILAVLAALGLLLAVVAPAMAADEQLPHTGRTIIVVGGDANLPAGDQADVVVVVKGDAVIDGTASAVVVIDGDVTLTGATIESLFLVNGRAELGAGTTVLDDVRHLNSEIVRADGVTVGGSVSGLEGELVGWAWFLGLAALLIWVGFALATVVVALLVAGLAGRQVRTAAALIGREPGKVVLTGFVALIGPPLLAALAIATIVGIPAGIGLLLVVWPFVAFIGYIVAAVWIGQWVVARTRSDPYEPERPYLAAFVGLVVAFVLGIVPLFTAIISILGMGAVVLAAWRTLRGGGLAQPVLRPHPAPMAG